MKNKIDFKLTACVVSLFISILLIAFCHHIKVVLCLGLILCAVSVFFFARIRVRKIQSILDATEIDLDENYSDEKADSEIVDEVYKEMHKLRKEQRSMKIYFNLFAGLLVFIAIFIMF